MAEEGFLRRWSRMKASGGEVAEAPPRPCTPVPSPAGAPAAVPSAAPTGVPTSPRTAAAAPEAPPPTLDDVARLTPESDFSAFVAQGVDKSVQRLALKKLFSDPHFRVMDGLDMYMDDYNKPSPMSAAMLAALEHAKSALRPSEPHKPQVTADAMDAAAAAAQEAAGSGEALAGQPPEPHVEPETEAEAEALPAGEPVPGAGALPSASEETDGIQAPAQVPAHAPVHSPIHTRIHARTQATPACTQTGTHPQSLQGQA